MDERFFIVSLLVVGCTGLFGVVFLPLSVIFVYAYAVWHSGRLEK